jgi:hypothetical protein
MKPNQHVPMSAAALPGIAGTIVLRRESRDSSPGGRDA